MNFFGHVVAASWSSSEAGFGLGAMLPDFATMIGARLVTASHDATERGVAWHHDTDAVFHRHPTFRRHSSLLTDRLAARGIGRGGSLAAGHVGVELILDGLLLEDQHRAAEGLYLEALAALEALVPAIELVRRGAGDRPHGSRAPRERLVELGQLLAERGLPHGYRDPDIVAERVLRVLRDRPRLAINADKRGVLAEVFAEVKLELAGESQALISDLRQALTSAPDASIDAGGAGGSPREPSSR